MAFPSGIVSAWPLEESSGTRLDVVSGHNAVVYGSDPSQAVGIYNYAAGFNGTTQGLRIPYHADFALGVDAVFTASGWFYLSPGFDGLDHVIMCKGPNGGLNPSWYVFHRFTGASSRLSMVRQALNGDRHVIDATSDLTGLPLVLTDSIWYKFACGIDADGRVFLTAGCNSRCYFTDLGDAPWIAQYTDDLYIGSGKDEGGGLQDDPFPGRLDEFYYWKSAKTDEELGFLCAGGSSSFYNSSSRYIIHVHASGRNDQYQAKGVTDRYQAGVPLDG